MDRDVLIKQIVDRFNSELRCWYLAHGHGANFKFVYEPSTGLKFLEITDVAPIDPSKPERSDDPRVLIAHGILSEALKEVSGE